MAVKVGSSILLLHRRKVASNGSVGDCSRQGVGVSQIGEDCYEFSTTLTP